MRKHSVTLTSKKIKERLYKERKTEDKAMNPTQVMLYEGKAKQIFKTDDDHKVITVSYTHLDVYKRQVRF